MCAILANGAVEHRNRRCNDGQGTQVEREQVAKQGTQEVESLVARSL
jgi:hypothetical protein